MNGKTLTLINIFGFKIKVNISWVFIALLLSWALAQGYFPTVYEGLTKFTYWWMSVVAVLGLFASIVMHELAHSMVARAFGMEIKDEPESLLLKALNGLKYFDDGQASLLQNDLVSLMGKEKNPLDLD